MKKHPKLVFVLDQGEYIELSYEQFCRMKEMSAEYEGKKYILVQGMLLEVPEKEYHAFYKDCRRQRYLQEQAQNYHVTSVEDLMTNDFAKERVDNLLVSQEPDILDRIVQREAAEALHRSISKLSAEEKLLIWRYFFCDIPQDKLAVIYGVNQSSISRRIDKIIEKIKKSEKI